MIYIGINNLRPGDIVSESIYDNNNRILVVGGTNLTEPLIIKLKELGFNGFYIDNKFSQNIVVEDLISEQLRNKTTEDLKSLDIKSTVENARRIVEKILQEENVLIDYVDIRNNKNKLFQHSIFVAEASVIIGITLGLNYNDLTDLAVSALLHDIGKLFVEPKMMSKILGEDSKNIEEYKEKSHPLYGFKLFRSDIKYNINVKINNTILFHHINENGTGTTGSDKYDILAKNIPLSAKIIHVVDEYDLKRHDKENGTPFEAIEYLKANCGLLFNTNVVKAFLKSVAIYPTGTTVTLSSGYKGVVCAQNKGFPDRPKIKLENGQTIDLMARFLQTFTIVSSELDGKEENVIGKFK